MKFRYATSLWSGQGCTQDQETAATIFLGLNEEEYVPSLTFSALLMKYSGDEELLKQAAQQYALAAEKGDAFAKSEYAIMLVAGQGVKKDERRAFQMLLELAGDESVETVQRAEAQCYVGIFYGSGVGVKRNMAAARMWLERAAQNGNQRAKDTLRELGY